MDVTLRYVSGRRRIIEAAEHEELGRFLKAVRKQQGCSQEQLAARMGVPQSYISKSESGERQFQFLEFIRFCEALGLEPEAVVTQYKSQS